MTTDPLSFVLRANFSFEFSTAGLHYIVSSSAEPSQRQQAAVVRHFLAYGCIDGRYPQVTNPVGPGFLMSPVIRRVRNGSLPSR